MSEGLIGLFVLLVVCVFVVLIKRLPRPRREEWLVDEHETITLPLKSSPRGADEEKN